MLAGLGALCLGGAVVAACLQRDAIAVHVALGFFREHGIASDIRLDRLDLSGVSGSLRLGPPGHPDLTVRRLEAGFGALPPIWGGLKPPPIRSLVLTGATLHARLRDGRLDVGSLQSLLDQALRSPSGGQPINLTIREGQLDLATPYGRLGIAIDAVLRSGRLVSLHARLEPVILTAADTRIAQVRGVVSGAAAGHRTLHLTGAFAADEARGRGGGGSGLIARLDGFAPDSWATPSNRAAVPLDATLRLRARRLTLPSPRGSTVELRNAEVTADLSGAASPITGFVGSLGMDGRAEQVGNGELALAGVGWRVRSPELRFTRIAGRAEASGSFSLALAADGGQLHRRGLGLTLAPLRLRSAGRLATGRSTTIEAAGDFGGGAELQRRDAVRIGHAALATVDPTAAAALTRALRRVRLEVASYVLALRSDGGLDLRLPRGAQVGLDSGRLDIAASRRSAAAPWLHETAQGVVSGAAAMRLRVADLPSLNLRVPEFTSTPSGRFRGGFDLAAQGGLGPARGVTLHARGRIAGGRSAGAWSWAVVAWHCWPISAAAVRIGQTSASGLSLTACPVLNAPLLAAGAGELRVRVRLADGDVTFPSARTHLSLENADLDVDRSRNRFVGQAEVKGLTVEDLTGRPRWRPVLASGGLTLDGPSLNGGLSLAAVRSGVPLGELGLRIGLADSSGQVTFTSAPLRFSLGALQPDDILPTAAAILPQADGQLQASARAAWNASGIVASSGEVRSDGLSFRSPAGRLDGLRGEVRLSSLLPLASAPDQMVTADRLETLLPLEAVKAVFTLEPDRLLLENNGAEVAGGHIALDPMAIPFAPGAGAAPPALTGVLRLKALDAQRLLDVLNLSNAVSLQARLDGALPFTLAPGSVGETLRITDGRIVAEGPGRLTLHRQALAGVLTAGSTATAQPNAVQDFAYQALEDLAFTQLDAEMASRPVGRLGAIFHIVGRHDPAVATPTRVGIWALLRGHAFDKPLPLPKDTPVDLTLDTSLNLDDVLEAFGLGQAAGSAPVQP